MEDTKSARIPEGFHQQASRNAFTENNGPFWLKNVEGEDVGYYGFLPGERHSNSLGFVHGGMIATFLDHSMAHFAASRYNCRLVTIELKLNFQKAVFPNRWAEARVEPETESKALASLIAKLYSRGSVCATATAEFRLFPRSNSSL